MLLQGFRATRNLIRYLKSPLGLLKEMSLAGDRVCFDLGSKPMVLLNHPDLIREAIVTKQKSFGRGSVFWRMNRLMVGSSLLTAEAAEHRQSRRLIQPVFHPHRLEVYAQCMLRAGELLAQSWQSGQTVDISLAMNQVTLQAVCASLFGPSVTRKSDRVFEVINDMLSMPFALYPHPLEPLFERYPSLTRLGRAVRRADRVIYPMIEERRAAADPTDDLLTMLIQAHEDEVGSFNDRQVRNETITLLLAGHETTAQSLSWAIYLLGQHPALQEELGAEAHALDEFAWDSLAKLPKLGQFFDETLRLYPPAWGLERPALEDVEIGGEVIPAGTTVLASQFLIHRDARFWEAPEDLRLDRWIPGAKKKAQEAFTYFPFGAGARMCIGEHFARAEALIILACLLKKWRFKKVNTVTPKALITLHPSEPVRTVVTAAP